MIKNLEDLTEKLKAVDENHNEKNKAVKKSMKEMEDLFLNKLCTLDKFENYRK
jgi:hypothetical protein